MDTKKDIRKRVFALRREASEQKITENSREIFRKVCDMAAYREAEAVYAYMDYNREVMTREFICRAWADGKQVAVPKVHGRDMVFYILEDFSQLEEGYFGIPEPARGEAAEQERALMIVPGVAFDAERHRIGYGQGFYDRYLEKHPHHPTIAVAFEFQMIGQVPHESTDIRPDCLVTEARIIYG